VKRGPGLRHLRHRSALSFRPSAISSLRRARHPCRRRRHCQLQERVRRLSMTKTRKVGRLPGLADFLRGGQGQGRARWGARMRDRRVWQRRRRRLAGHRVHEHDKPRELEIGPARSDGMGCRMRKRKLLCLDQRLAALAHPPHNIRCSFSVAQRLSPVCATDQAYFTRGQPILTHLRLRTKLPCLCVMLPPSPDARLLASAQRRAAMDVLQAHAPAQHDLSGTRSHGSEPSASHSPSYSPPGAASSWRTRPSGTHPSSHADWTYAPSVPSRPLMGSHVPPAPQPAEHLHHRVYTLNCAHCNAFLSDRGMRVRCIPFRVCRSRRISS
jgi:hypothetical protein